MSYAAIYFNILILHLRHLCLASAGSSKGETRRFIFSKNIKKTCEAIAVNLLLISKSAEKKTYSSDSDFPSPYS